ncbi:hypothetical protein Cni_G08277 [Canna indica]|uniref:DUF3741 domain-containing protein n=1 Tax=Canna indica TaxID=4628 RepID=A0AAQ3Q7S5_9LILI|nr:hypothetical protein Cni_G08277 [Canna indica]
MTLGMINAHPVVHAKKERITRSEDLHSDDALDALDSVRDIKDPEHPYSLEQLSVLSEESITVDEKLGRIKITFTPTVKHCSMATVIGLCLRVKLMQCFPPHFKVDINVSPGSLANEEAVNKQLNDKERVSAALENPSLRQLVDECLYSNELYSCHSNDLGVMVIFLVQLSSEVIFSLTICTFTAFTLMAKRSDFAQKLLDDLRLRKEKLGYITPSGQQSAQPPSTEYHGNSQRSARVTGEAITKNYNSKNMVSTAVTEIWFSTKQNKMATPNFDSKEIVPVGRATNIQNSVDASMALALALSNSGKLHYIAKFGNEIIPHTGSIYYRESGNQHLTYSMKHHASQYPFLSNLQISEISKGVQKLNRILETCSDRSNFGRDSIQIGRELLKGAMDLEDSLKMLVTLQEASDYMVGSQGRQVRLLKGKEEDESSSRKVNQKTIQYKTKIYIDKSTDHFCKVVKANDDTIIQGQRKLPLSYTRKGMAKTSYDESSLNASVNINTHRRSLSYGPDSMPNSLYSGVTGKNDHGDEVQNFSTSKGKSSASNKTKQLDPKSPGGGNIRMPSIVAKLMGLEELPTAKVEVKKFVGQKDPKSKKNMVTDDALDADAKVRKEVISNQRHLSQSSEENRILNEKYSEETKAKSNKGKTYSIQNVSPSANHAPTNHSKKNMTNHSSKEGITRSNFIQSREKKEEREQRSKRAGSILQDLRPNQDSNMQIIQKKSSWRHDEADGKKDALLNKDNERDRLDLASDQKNTQMSQKKSTAHMTKPKHAVHEIPKEKEHDVNSKLKATAATETNQKPRKSTDKICTEKELSIDTVLARDNSGDGGNIEQQEEHPKSSHTEMQSVMNKTSDCVELARKISYVNSDGINSLLTYTTTEKGKTLPQNSLAPLINPVQVPIAKKIDAPNLKVHRSENHKVMSDSPGYIKIPNKKSQSSFLNELEKRWKERTSKDKGATISFSESNSKQNLEQEIKSTLPSDDFVIDSGTDKEVLQEILAEETHGGDMNKTASEALQKQEDSLCMDSEPKLSNLEEKEKEGSTENKNINNCNLLKWQNQAILKANRQGLLTEDEHLLKQLLIKNQHFLNTAQALFKIKIPIDVLQTSTQACSKEENKLLLDCGCELVRRKGRREVIHSMTRPYATSKVRDLDGLMKELNNDIECLKFSNKSRLNDDTAEFLQRMIERDIENRNPDINCMWDIGWSNTIFALIEKEEVARDLEKHVLSGLISELASEFRNATTIVS